MFISLIGKLFRSGTVWVVVASSTVWGSYMVVKPTEPVPSARQNKAIGELAPRVSEWLSRIEAPRAKTVFLNLDRDPFGKVSDVVRHVIWQTDRFDLQDYSMTEKLRRQIKWSRATVGSREEAARAGRGRGCEYAIWGSVREFSEAGSAARLSVDLEIVETSGRAVIASREFHIAESDGLPLKLPREVLAQEAGERSISLPIRFLIWILIALLIPIATYPLAQRMLAGESNLAVLATLAGYVAASVAAAYLLLAWGAGSWGTGIVLLVAFGLSLLYDWKALDFIKRSVDAGGLS